MSTSGSRRAIIAALAANAGIAVAKFVGFLITSSSSMLAESVHSLADSGNQALLLVGQKRSRKVADAEHQFGYGTYRFFYAFVVALVIFMLGSVFALYEGIHKLSDPEPLTRPIVAIVILLVALGLESYSLRTAIVESNHVRGGKSWWQFIRTARTPELPVVLLEDTGALVGLVLALGGVGLTMATDDPVWDAIGTICIGVLLGLIAIILIIETRSLLIGEAALPEVQAQIRRELGPDTGDHVIQGVIHMRTQHLSPEDILIAAKVAIHPEVTMAEVSAAINDAERRIRDAVPDATLVYIEPDLRHAEGPGTAIPPLRRRSDEAPAALERAPDR